jgi:hypothetical protein
MSDAKQNPAARTDRKPQNQTGEDNGPVKRPQVTEERMERDNVAAGSADDRRRASKGAR